MIKHGSGLTQQFLLGIGHLAKLMVAIEALAVDLMHGTQLPQRVECDDPGGHHDELRITIAAQMSETAETQMDNPSFSKRRDWR